jgi:hypothetical protein
MTYYTVGRVGSIYRRYHHFFVFHVGVKMYEPKKGRDGVVRLKFIGAVEGTVTLDRYYRMKKHKLAQTIAAERKGQYRMWIKHNQVLDPLEALAAMTGDST